MAWPHDRFVIPGTSSISSLFVFPDDKPVVVNQQALDQQNKILSQTIKDPNTYKQPNDMGIKENYPPEPSIPVNGGDGKKDPNSPPCGSADSDIAAFLDKCLAEAAQGLWRESGQGGKPSNPNILGAWKNIGLNCKSDQTPWCMVFVQFVLKQTGHNYMATASAADASNPKLKTTLVTKKAEEVKTLGRPGDIVQFRRTGGSGFHVAVLYSADPFSWVGGNQTPSGKHGEDDGDVTKRQAGPQAMQSFAALWRPSCL